MILLIDKNPFLWVKVEGILSCVLLEKSPHHVIALFFEADLPVQYRSQPGNRSMGVRQVGEHLFVEETIILQLI
jgi:hypothetical protein